MIPFTPDCEYQYGEEVLPPEKISRLAKSFEDYKIIDLQHEFTKRLINKQQPIPRGKLLKSYISKEKLHLMGLDGYVREYPAGTWIISVEITEPEAMKLYQNGNLTGVSVTVKEKEHANAIIDFLENHDIPYLPQEIIEAEKGFYKKPKRILMKDVVNPVAFTVSLVKSPCVYGAKFCKNSCLIANRDKLEEKKIVNLKEKIKKEINNFIDGLDVDEESIKEDIETEETIEESAKEETGVPEVPEESVKDDGDSGDDNGNEGTQTAGAGEGSAEGDGADLDGSDEGGDSTSEEGEPKESKSDDNENGNGTGKKKEVEAKKEDISEESSEESEKGTSEKCDGGKTKSMYGRKVKVPEAKKEDVTETESDKDVLYLAQDDVENLISTTLRRYAEEVEQMVFDGIQEALDDYLFANGYAYKEDIEEIKEKEDEEEEKPEEVEEEEESQKEYVTSDMVQSMLDEQMGSFKSSIMDGIKQAQKESIKSYSKAINQTNDGFEKQESQKETFTKKVQRDLNGCRIKRR